VVAVPLAGAVVGAVVVPLAGAVVAVPLAGAVVVAPAGAVVDAAAGEVVVVVGVAGADSFFKLATIFAGGAGILLLFDGGTNATTSSSWF